MRLISTLIEAETITLLFADAGTRDEAIEKIEIRVKGTANQLGLLAEAQLNALDRARTVIGDEIQAIRSRVRQGPGA